MEISRRKFLELGAAVGAGVLTEALISPDVSSSYQDVVETARDAAESELEWRWVENEPITAEWAAGNLGKDAWSRDPDNWQENQYGGVMLLSRPDNTTIQVKTGETNIDAWLKPARVDHLNQALVLSVYGKGQEELELNGGTFWKPREERKGDAFWHWFNLHQQLVCREAIEQPDAFILKVGCPDLEADLPWIENHRRPKEWFAYQLGMDNWSRDPDNWQENQYGGVMLLSRPDDTTTRVRIDGVNVDAWIKPAKVGHENQAVVLSVYGGPGGQTELELNGGTFWVPCVQKPEDMFAHWYHLNKQLHARETREQPDAIILEVGCPFPYKEARYEIFGPLGWMR